MTTVMRLQNVYLVAREPGKLDAFYADALGLPLKFRDAERWVQYNLGNASLSLACPEEAAPATSGAVVVLEVDDFEQEGLRPRIESAGGQVLGVRDMGAHGAVLSLRDPEGNVVQLFKRAAAPAAA
ncbi:VOC family protein [Variovorax sp. OV329]|uniref:VOC family protein n=1 Tax=Variovorax sp. OV329 TaxID=1882825 RepID=UPI0008E749D2|nr:VOC family protein [Variovorax sp. OV329]SFM18561.1 Glyoxalase/Bleomycin resistance protein/Dioxygenase superfamily protein [Variovorax sp. OV329]